MFLVLWFCSSNILCRKKFQLAIPITFVIFKVVILILTLLFCLWKGHLFIILFLRIRLSQKHVIYCSQHWFYLPGISRKFIKSCRVIHRYPFLFHTNTTSGPTGVNAERLITMGRRRSRLTTRVKTFYIIAIQKWKVFIIIKLTGVFRFDIIKCPFVTGLILFLLPTV